MNLEFILSKAYRQILQLFSANLAKAFFGFIGTLFVLRGWSTADIGDIYTLVGVLLLFQQFGDLGTGSSFIQIISRSRTKNESVIAPFLGFKVLVTSILFLLFIAICCIYFFFLPTQEIYGLAIICLAAIFGIYGGFFTSLINSRQEFGNLTILKVTPTLIKTLFIALLYWLQWTDFFWLLLAFSIPGITLFFVGYYYTGYPFYKGSVASIFSKRGKQLYQMSRWVFLAGFAQTWFSQIDVFMLKKMSSDYQIAQFVGAQKLSAVVILFSQAIFTVMLPKMRSFRKNKELRGLCKKLFLFYWICLILMVPGIYLAPYAVPIVLGPKYLDSIPILQVFIFQALGYMFIISQSLVFFRKNQMPVYVVLICTQLFLNFVFNYMVIPEYKALGAVWVSTILNNVFYFITLLASLWILKENRAKVKS